MPFVLLARDDEHAIAGDGGGGICAHPVEAAAWHRPGGVDSIVSFLAVPGEVFLLKGKGTAPNEAFVLRGRGQYQERGFVERTEAGGSIMPG